MNKKTVVILKPDAIERGKVREILEMLRQQFRIGRLEKYRARPEQLQQHYPDSMAKGMAEAMSKQLDRPVSKKEGMQAVRSLRNYMQRTPIIILEVKRARIDQDVIKEVRTLIGATHPVEADDATIRGKFRLPAADYQQAIKEGKHLENLIHASDSPAAVTKEMKIWFE